MEPWANLHDLDLALADGWMVVWIGIQKENFDLGCDLAQGERSNSKNLWNKIQDTSWGSRIDNKQIISQVTDIARVATES